MPELPHAPEITYDLAERDTPSVTPMVSARVDEVDIYAPTVDWSTVSDRLPEESIQPRTPVDPSLASPTTAGPEGGWWADSIAGITSLLQRTVTTVNEVIWGAEHPPIVGTDTLHRQGVAQNNRELEVIRAIQSDNEYGCNPDPLTGTMARGSEDIDPYLISPFSPLRDCDDKGSRSNYDVCRRPPDPDNPVPSEIHARGMDKLAVDDYDAQTIRKNVANLRWNGLGLADDSGMAYLFDLILTQIGTRFFSYSLGDTPWASYTPWYYLTYPDVFCRTLIFIIGLLIIASTLPLLVIPLVSLLAPLIITVVIGGISLLVLSILNLVFFVVDLALDHPYIVLALFAAGLVMVTGHYLVYSKVFSQGDAAAGSQVNEARSYPVFTGRGL